jgi:hypothetical protein
VPEKRGGGMRIASGPGPGSSLALLLVNPTSVCARVNDDSGFTPDEMSESDDGDTNTDFDAEVEG